MALRKIIYGDKGGTLNPNELGGTIFPITRKKKAAPPVRPVISMYRKYMPRLEGMHHHIDIAGNDTAPWGVNKQWYKKEIQELVRLQEYSSDEELTIDDWGIIGENAWKNRIDDLDKNVPEFSTLSDEHQFIIADAYYNTNNRYKGLATALAAYEADDSHENV